MAVSSRTSDENFPPRAGRGRDALVEALRAELSRAARTAGRDAPQTGSDAGAEGERISTGWPALDRLLPERGLPRGSLSEWLAVGPASGGGQLALGAAAQAVAASGRPVVVIDATGEFYPPAVAAVGLDLKQVLVVRPGNRADLWWAWDQVLRSGAVAGAWGWLDALDERTFRRLQLAAEAGRTWGFLLRPEAARATPSWAEVRLGVEPLARPASRAGPGGSGQAGVWPGDRLCRVELLRGRGMLLGRQVVVELSDPRRLTGATRPLTAGGHDDSSPGLPMVSPLAVAAVAPRPA